MKNFFSIISMLLAVVSATAQNFEATITWDRPGAVKIGVGSISDFVPVELAPGQTSYTISQASEHVVMAGDGFFISKVDKDGTDVRVGINNEHGQFFFIGPYGNNNGKTFAVTTEKLVYDRSINIDVVNGADYVLAQLENSTDNSKTTGTIARLRQGMQEVKLSQFDNTLTLNRNGTFAEKSFYSVKRGDKVLESTSKFYPSYRLEDLQDGETVTITVRDPAITVKNCTVTLDINDLAALVSIRDWQHSSWIWPADIMPGWSLQIEEGQNLTFNFNEAYRIEAFLANSDSVAINPGNNSARVSVNKDTRFTVKAAPIVYEDVEMCIYTNNKDAIVVSDAPDAGAGIYDLGAGEPLTSDVVLATSPQEVIPAGSAMKYTIKVPGKNPKFFWRVKEGFYAAKAYLCNPSDKTYYIANGAVAAAEAPLWLDIRQIECRATAAVFYNGPEGGARLVAYDNSGLSAQGYEGMAESLEPGYNEIKFDPAYHTSFRVRSITASDRDNLYVYNNGSRVAEDSDSPGVFRTTLADSTALKIFLAPKAPKAFSATIEAEDGTSAQICYDKVRRPAPGSSEIASFGPTAITIVPAAGTGVTIDGLPATIPADGVLELTSEAGKHTIALTAGASVGDIAVPAADRYTVVSLAGVTLLKDVDAEALKSLQTGIYIINGIKVIIHN